MIKQNMLNDTDYEKIRKYFNVLVEVTKHLKYNETLDRKKYLEIIEMCENRKKN